MTRNRLHRTEALVLKRSDYGEADRILTLLTPDRGKVSAIAKGVRRLTSRNGAHVELFTHAHVVLARGRSLDVVTQAEAIRTLRAVRDDLTRATYAYHIAEFAYRFATEGHPERGLFALVRDAFGALDETTDPPLLARFFELRALDLLGFRPELFACAACGNDLTENGNAYSPSDGGVICISCSGLDIELGPREPRRGAKMVPLAGKSFRLLRFLQTREWGEVQRLAVGSAAMGAIEDILTAQISHLLEREMKSVEFLASLRAGIDAAPDQGPT